MDPFTHDPQAILNEIRDFRQKIMSGVETLKQVGDIEIGCSAKSEVYREDKVVLYRYKSRTKKQRAVPLLVVYALVNRPYMADLQPGRSLIEGLLDQGIDVYLIDWGYPDDADCYLSLEDYIAGYLNRCIDFIRRDRKLKQINLFGICQGGTFSLCYASLYPEKVKSLITTVTPVDFHTPEDSLSLMVREVDIDLLFDATGNMPGDLLNFSFLMLKPFRLMGQKYLDMVDIMDDPEKLRGFLRMEKWIFDSPDQAGEAYRQFIKKFYQDNCLVSGSALLGSREIDLRQVTMPVLNIYAAKDHLVPPKSSKALRHLVGTKDYTEIEFPGGHIGVFVSGKAQGMIPPQVGTWLEKRART